MYRRETEAAGATRRPGRDLVALIAELSEALRQLADGPCGDDACREGVETWSDDGAIYAECALPRGPARDVEISFAGGRAFIRIGR